MLATGVPNQFFLLIVVYCMGLGLDLGRGVLCKLVTVVFDCSAAETAAIGPRDYLERLEGLTAETAATVPRHYLERSLGLAAEAAVGAQAMRFSYSLKYFPFYMTWL